MTLEEAFEIIKDGLESTSSDAEQLEALDVVCEGIKRGVVIIRKEPNTDILAALEHYDKVPNITISKDGKMKHVTLNVKKVKKHVSKIDLEDIADEDD